MEGSVPESNAPSGTPPLVRINVVIGRRLDPSLAERLHRLEHRGLVDTVEIAPADLPRHRFRATSQSGRTIEFALPRDQSLFDGAVLSLDEAGALVVRVAAQRWLRLMPETRDDALAVGYQAGNMHWRVRFDGAALLIAMEAPAQDYLVRLGALGAPGRLRWDVIDAGPC